MHRACSCAGHHKVRSGIASVSPRDVPPGLLEEMTKRLTQPIPATRGCRSGFMIECESGGSTTLIYVRFLRIQRRKLPWDFLRLAIDQLLDITRGQSSNMRPFPVTPEI